MGDELLERVGLLLLHDQLRSPMLEYIARTLDIRINTSLRARMSDEERQEFQRLSDLGDAPVRLWLERNFPDFMNIADEEFDKLCADILSVAPDILRDEGITES